MKSNVTIARVALSLTQAALLLLSTTAPSLALSTSASQIKASDSARLDRFEHILFGYTKSNLSTESRLNAIETNVFGATKTGPPNTRLNAIAKALGNKDDNYLLPPMAPKMDTQAPVAAAPPPRPATSQPYEESSSSYGQSAAPGDSQNDKAKEALGQAVQLYSQNRTDDAQRAFQHVLALDSRNVDAYYNLGVIAEGKGNLPEALSNYKKAQSLNPGDSSLSDAVNGVETKLDSQQKALAEAKNIQQQAKTKDRLKGLVSEASSAYKAGNYDKAIQDLQTVSQQAPNDPDVLYALAQAYKGKGMTEQARGALSRAMSIDPNNPLYRTAMADLGNSAPSSGGGNGYSSNGYGQNQYGNGANLASNNTPTGQLTPFTPTDQNGQYFAGRTSQNNGPSMGYSGFGGGMAGGMMSPTRLKRAAVGGLAGAAVGALWGGTTHGSIKRDAVRGALVGSVMGLLMGRY